MRNPRIVSGTVVRIAAIAVVLGLVVLAGASPETDSAVPTESSPGGGAVAQLAAVSTPAATAVAPAAEQPRRMIYGTGGMVTLHLQRTDSNGSPVSGGTQIDWKIVAVVSTGDNEGLALVSVDLVQDPTNTAFFDIPFGARPTGTGGMDKFDRPLGISNPDGSGGSAYGGTQIGTAGAMNLVQIGGAQNMFGETFTGVLEDATIEDKVGQEANGAGRVIATGSFPAPFPIGTYKFDLADGVANTLIDVNTPPAYSRVSAATVDVLTNGSFTFMVQ